MTQHLPIWEIGRIPPSVCDAAVAEFEELPVKDASMGLDGDLVEHTQRNTAVRFAPENHWFGGLMFDFAVQANKKHWGYYLDDREAIQYATYGSEQHYDWHVDTFPLAGTPTDRKVTVVCLMNESGDFLGGEFQLRLAHDYTAPLEKGSVIAFPSILFHRVAPVLSGVRKTSTLWLSGPRFR